MGQHIGRTRSDVEYEADAGRGRRRGLWIVGALAIPVLLAGAIPSPYVIERPGPVVDTLGDVTVDDATEPVVSFPDAQTYPTSGTLNLLTVQILGDPDRRRSWLSLLPAVVDPSQRIAPLSDFFRDGETSDDRDAQNTALMASSQTLAAAAAFREVGEDVDVVLSVAEVAGGSAADGVLEPGDRLVALDGEPIESFAMLRERTIATGGDEPLRVGIERDGEPVDVELTPTIPDGATEPLIGATVATDFELPSEVEIQLEDIGGPSAGMAFSLAMYDRLTPGEMLDGMTVSGTGTMADTGEVGPIGGLEQKMWAAARAESDLFLMPLGNCADVPERIPDGLRVAPVATLTEAIDAIETAASGDSPAGLERCGAEISARSQSS